MMKSIALIVVGFFATALALVSALSGALAAAGAWLAAAVVLAAVGLAIANHENKGIIAAEASAVVTPAIS